MCCPVSTFEGGPRISGHSMRIVYGFHVLDIQWGRRMLASNVAVCLPRHVLALSNP